jgi:hypothetical protein
MAKHKHYSPKQVALAKWNNEQRPKYEERIKHDERRTMALRRAEIRVMMTRK